MNKLSLAASLGLATLACSSTTPKVAPTAPAKATEIAKVSLPAMKPHEVYRNQCSDDMAAARAKVKQTIAAKDRTVDGTLAPYNDAILLLRDAGARSELFGEVHPDADYRAAADDCTKEVERVAQEILLDRQLFEAIKAVPEEG